MRYIKHAMKLRKKDRTKTTFEFQQVDSWKEFIQYIGSEKEALAFINTHLKIYLSNLLRNRARISNEDHSFQEWLKAAVPSQSKRAKIEARIKQLQEQLKEL